MDSSPAVVCGEEAAWEAHGVVEWEEEDLETSTHTCPCLETITLAVHSEWVICSPEASLNRVAPEAVPEAEEMAVQDEAVAEAGATGRVFFLWSIKGDVSNEY